MELRYDDCLKNIYNKKMSFNIVFLVAIIFQCVVYGFLMIKYIIFSITLIVLFFIEVLMCIIFILVYIKAVKEKNNKREIKEFGTRISANIIDVCTIVKKTGKYDSITVNCFMVGYDNNQKKSRIDFIEDNDAYKLLTMLLNPYPIMEKVDIPIDIYIHNNEVYADLESVDFTKIKGYKECKKAIDQIYHNE